MFNFVTMLTVSILVLVLFTFVRPVTADHIVTVFALSYEQFWSNVGLDATDWCQDNLLRPLRPKFTLRTVCRRFSSSGTISSHPQHH